MNPAMPVARQHRIHQRSYAAKLMLFCPLLSLAIHSTAAPGDERWDFRFGRVGVDGALLALASDGIDLYLGGSFHTAGHNLANCVARWDGSEFHPLGDGLQTTNFNAAVSALATCCGLLAGGQFEFSGTNRVSGLARWDGTRWVPFGGVAGTIYALPLIEHSFDTNAPYCCVTPPPTLYAGGAFTIDGGSNVFGVARWDYDDRCDVGTWETFNSVLGCAFCDPAIYAIAAREDGSEIIISGQFDSIAGLPITDHARWNGTNWGQFPAAMDGWISDVRFHEGSLFAAGNFTTINGVNATNIARWDGTNWWPVGDGLDAPCDRLYSDPFYDLIAVGTFTRSGNIPLDKVARWDGSLFYPLGTNVFRSSEQPYVAVNHQFRLHLGGYFNSVHGKPAGGVAEWHDSLANEHWEPVTPQVMRGLGGTLGFGYAFASDSNSVYVGGYFDSAGAVAASRVAQLTSTGMMAFPGAITNPSNARVRALALSGSNLFVGGFFTNVGTNVVRNLIQWNGHEWLDPGGGVNSNVQALVSANGKVFVGGLFTAAGGISASRIACWDGTNWSALGSGLSSSVAALAWSDDRLCAGGTFTNAGGAIAKRIAVWNGAQWSALGGGIDDSNGLVNTIAISGTNIFVGGRFSSVSGRLATNVAVWNGLEWNPLGGIPGNGVDGQVYALAILNGQLFVGGNFEHAGGMPIKALARWDGTNWSALGSGIAYPQTLSDISRVFALHARGGDLYIGGAFTVAGEIPSYGIARWIEVPQFRFTSVRHSSGDTRYTLKGVGGLSIEVERADKLSGWLGWGLPRRCETDDLDDAFVIIGLEAPMQFFRAKLSSPASPQ